MNIIEKIKTCVLYLTWLLSIFYGGLSTAQNRANTQSTNLQKGDSNSEKEIIKEEPNINYFYLTNLDDIKKISDTSLVEFEKYARQRRFDTAALNLGNHGSAHRQIAYSSTKDIFTDIGFHQYDLNKLSLDKLRFYKLNRAYNDLYFSPHRGQQNFEVKANFSRNFASDINLTIDFERINQEGFYSNQDTKMTRLGVGFWKHNKDKNHDLFISFLANNFNEVHSGGIDTTGFDINSNLTGSIRTPRSSAPTLLSGEGITRHQQFSYAVDNFWTTKNDKFKLHHRAMIENGYYRFGDEDVSSIGDTLVYQNYITEARGIRFFNSYFRLSNQLDLGLKIKDFDLTFGFKYKFLNYNNGNDNQNINDLSLSGILNYKIGTISQLHAKAEIGVGENAGNFLASGKLHITPIKKFKIEAHADISRHDPSLIQQSVIITEQSIFQNEFSKVNNVNIGGKLEFQKWNISLEANSGLIDNAIYYNEMAMPTQLNESTEYFQAKLKQDIFWKFIGFENSVLYQKFSNNIYRLPDIYSIHNLYLQGRLFKKRLNARIGILIYNTRYDGYLKFLPVTGTFYPTDDKIKYFPYSEMYATFSIDAFRIFFRYDNLVDRFQPEVHYQIYNYAQFDAKFRMGVRWIIFD